jgi:hemerythrin
MKPSEIRDELIAQHRGLRARIDAARLASLRWTSGEASESHVRDALAELADALRAHHLREESTLRELIRSIDAPGTEREEIMDDEHVREHREMFDTLSRVGNTQAPADAGRELESFCSQMLAHMTWEEKAFLNRSVLRDDADDD